MVDSFHKDIETREMMTSQIEALLTAANAKALYQSLDAQESAKKVREELMRMEISSEQFSWREMARYLAMKSDTWQR